MSISILSHSFNLLSVACDYNSTTFTITLSWISLYLTFLPKSLKNKKFDIILSYVSKNLISMNLI